LNVQLGGITAVVRILVVDDHDATRRILSSFLAHEDNFTICGEAADGMQAIEQARNLSPDAVVMDVSMPKMDGLSAAHHSPGESFDTDRDCQPARTFNPENGRFTTLAWLLSIRRR
jgi:hypothetical protein